MLAEPLLLDLVGLLDRHLVDDISLRAILDTDIAETHGHFLTLEHVPSVGTIVHDIELGDDTDRSVALRVDLTRHLQTIRQRHIHIGGKYAKNNSSLVLNIVSAHVLRNTLNILSLAVDGNTRNTGKIDECQIGASRRVHRQHNRHVLDVLRFTADLISQEFDTCLHLLEVGELLAELFKLGPGLLTLGQVVETKLKWTTSAHTVTSWQKVETNDRLEHGRFTS